MKKNDMLTEIERRKEHLLERNDFAVGDEPMLVAQLKNIECAVRSGKRSKAAWEQHELHWMAHTAEMHRSAVRQSAQAMLAFKDLLRREPDSIVMDPELQRILYWWREENGREEFLGQITIEERRSLEALEQHWRNDAR